MTAGRTKGELYNIANDIAKTLRGLELSNDDWDIVVDALKNAVIEARTRDIIADAIGEDK